MRDEFYVAYRPVPEGQRRFLRAVVPALLAGIAVVGFLLARFQRDPGGGVWQARGALRRVGVVAELPHLQFDGPLLVGEGKVGAPADLRGASEVDGNVLRRGSLELLEVTRAVARSGPGSRPEGTIGDRVVVRGEIVDPKCFAGAMKPGDGKTHKACAALCARGGIPPVLVEWVGGESFRYYVLADEAGERLAGEKLDAVLPFVGDRVEVSGVSEVRGGMPVIRLERVVRS